MTWDEFVENGLNTLDCEQERAFTEYILENKVLKDYICNSGFLTAPASTKYHGSYEGGLAEHSINVMHGLVYLTHDCCLDWSRPESPYIIGLFHDICKVDQYKSEIVKLPYYADGKELEAVMHPVPGQYEYNKETLLKGHGDKSVMMLASLIQLTEEEVMCIRYHMGAFTDKEEWDFYTRAIHKYPKVLWTHHADMLATHVKEVENG